MSFLDAYFNLSECGKGVAVCCPFPHTLPGAEVQYFEQHPSAHVNTEEGLFHCKVCDRGYNEVSFITEVLGCSYINAVRLKFLYNHIETGDLFEWERDTTLTEETNKLLQNFHIYDRTASALHIKTGKDNSISFPVFMYDKLLDIRQYRPTEHPKTKSLLNAIAGLIVPYDLWREQRDKITIICAGEKDMAVARCHGLNAITITGGENTLPIITKEFEGRKVIIVYDNDDPGKAGAIHLANFLKPIAASIKNCTEFHKVCTENKEDITDFFNKYHKTKEDLINFFEATPEFEYQEESTGLHKYPIVDLRTASSPEYLGKLVRSNLQVVASSECAFVVPATLIGEKYGAGQKDDTMVLGEMREWNLTEDTVQDILHIMDNNFTESTIKEHYRNILKIMQKEKMIRIIKPTKETVFKAYVTDLFETSSTNTVPMEYMAYSLHCKLESGKKYLATYKLVPHPYNGQQLIMLITKVVQANDSVTNYHVTPQEIENLKVFQALQGTVAERITLCVEKFKEVLGYNGNNQLITCLDLAYHTALEFNFGSFQHVRGYLDTLIVGESRMGKSSTAEAMRNVYGLGAFVSLAGNAATIPGLIGGSNKVNNSYQTRAGLIPQNHKGLMIFEELGKCNANIISELTDIRSSNEVRITRVAGALTLPAVVRMITLSNVKTYEGVIKPIASYPNGITILTELVGTAEDIARYDLAVVLGDRGATHIDPYWVPQKAFETDLYRSRVRWVWSRMAEQIIISPEVGHYIVEEANKLNEIYDSHIKIFGTEAWKKITRLAISVAGYLVSTDTLFQNLVVEKEHVDFAVDFLIKLYDNDMFKLKEYVDHEKKYSTIDEDGIRILQEVFDKNAAFILHLEQVPSTSKNALQAASGMENTEYNFQMNKLVSSMFVKFSKYDIIPTQRFRLGVARINRTRALRLGEIQ